MKTGSERKEGRKENKLAIKSRNNEMLMKDNNNNPIAFIKDNRKDETKKKKKLICDLLSLKKLGRLWLLQAHRKYKHVHQKNKNRWQ